MDQPGERGANQYTYFVTTDLADEWRKLPDIKYEDVVSARRIRRLFTGNPDAKVITHPFFDGTEEVLLRAQIARITADTVLCPAGWMVPGGEPDEDPPPPPVQAEEFTMPLPSELVKK